MAFFSEDFQSRLKRLVVFVHGFGSTSSCWDQLIDLYQTDKSLQNEFVFERFSYVTQWFNARIWKRIPRLQELGRSLGRFLESSDWADYREIILVGHSQGGLVIQAYLAETLSRGNAEDLSRIRQIVLIATPNTGSYFLSKIRKPLSVIFPNPQERILRVFDLEIKDIHGQVIEQVVGAIGPHRVVSAIPIHSYWGTQDGIVLEASARGSFDSESTSPLDGDHFSVIRPKSHVDPLYKALSEALREPTGHRHVAEIDLYELSISVFPVAEIGAVEFKSQNGRTRRVKSDNRAIIDRSITFSRKNRCTDLFTMRYTTKNDGFLTVLTDPPNEAPPHDLTPFEEYGTSHVYAFTPKRAKTFKYFVDVYGGFYEGHRDAHFHLSPPGIKAYYKIIRISLVLTRYIQAGMEVSKGPFLYFHVKDNGHSEMCRNRPLIKPVVASSNDEPGSWTWELFDLREGVLDLVWDLKLAASS